jgi:hypothetical protein
LRRLLDVLLPLADVALAPVVYPSARILKAIRRRGVSRMPLCKRALMQVGVFPILNHYYEPLFDSRLLTRPMDEDRDLPGIDWNVSEQLSWLERLCFSGELEDVPRSKVEDLTFYLNNRAFVEGDAEYWYNMIRLKKPARIFEIGSGHSTLMARRAIDRNRGETPTYRCKHICIEPYERPWLEKVGVTVIRRKVEDIDRALFAELEKDDILFIDSSHVIRPQGDVLFEYLQLLPTLKIGVLVHVHDIFSPKDYLREWITDEVHLWNEQYLLEAFLTSNRDWKIVGALNYLHHKHHERLRATCPFLTIDSEPGSFYIERIA